jgi:exopolyphosphatase / guanosine-5'-triphosphate,3'-diphosphate pyrophosphatase
LEKIASIDIGSNTLRLLIAEKTAEGYQPVCRDREIIRLGRNFYPHRLLAPSAMEGAVRVLKRFKDRADQEGVIRFMAVGTGVLREAKNSPIFLENIRRETGLPVRIIPGLEEAIIMARGVLSIFPLRPGIIFIFDMGGGSTEFVMLKDGVMVERVSLPLGVVALTERFLLSDPPMEKERHSLKVYGRNILKKNLGKNDKINYLIGTAGTVTTLAAMVNHYTNYNPDQINGMALTKDQVFTLGREIFTLPLDRRANLPGLETGRADIIGAGILLVLEIMDHFSQETLWVSDSGLLEGLIL